jgi:putative heme-binding domain-containing protein
MVATGYTGAELTGLVAYLRNMSSYDPRGARIGDAAAGRELFYAAGECSTCHRVGGIGPKFAPDLTAIGALRSAATLERILLDPTGSLLPINRPVRAVTGDGRVINGRRLNEDTFRVQLIADDESLVSLDKAALREYTIGGESMMPDYGDRFSERQIADLVAFLLTLKGLN